MGPNGILDMLTKGPLGAAALAIAALTAVFGLLLRSSGGRLDDAKEQIAALREQLRALTAKAESAQEKETAALKTVLPVVEKLLGVVSLYEAKNRRRGDDKTNPGVRNPLLEVQK
jgi:hypothetical protein